MFRSARIIGFATLSILCASLAAQADSLRCTSINGNLNCVGSNGVSCQTVDGRKVCVSRHGDVIQSFGNGRSVDPHMDAAPRLPRWLDDRTHPWSRTAPGAHEPEWQSYNDE